MTLGGTEGETGTTRTQTKTITTSEDGETTVEVRTVTQTRIVEMVEGDVEDAEADFTIEAGSPPQLQTPLRGCVVNEGETARLQCQISCDVELEISWSVVRHTHSIYFVYIIIYLLSFKSLLLS